MPKKSAAHQKKVDEAVRILNTTTGVIVPQAMILAGFPKKDIANETVRRMIHRRLGALEAKQRPLLVVTNNDADLSTLTGGEDDETDGVCDNNDNNDGTGAAPQAEAKTDSAYRTRHPAKSRRQSSGKKAQV